MNNDGSIRGFPSFSDWLPKAIPKIGRRDAHWDWPWHKHLRQKLRDVTLGRINRLALAIPRQHGKTNILTIGYVLWRMVRTPGLRVAICCHTQTYAEFNVKHIRRRAVALGVALGETIRQDRLEFANGSTLIARGVGAALTGESIDLCVVDDPFGRGSEAHSPTVQEATYVWYMDDVTPPIQKDGAVIIVHTRYNPADLIGRILESEEGPEWTYVAFKALAEEGDILGRKPGEALCDDLFPLEKLLQKRRSMGVGFESQYQQNPIPRGGRFFERTWFAVIPQLPAGAQKGMRIVRYWDLASSRSDSSCYTSGVLMAKVGTTDATYYILDVIRGHWSPGERNEEIRKTAVADETRPGFERTWFEKPVFDKKGEATRAIARALAGHRFAADNVAGQGSKELRAEPLSAAALAGLVKIVAGPWVAAFLTELEGFPNASYKDQVDSSSGAFTKLTLAQGTISLNGERIT